MSALDIAHAVKDKKFSALEATEAALARIAKYDSTLNSFTDVTAERARAKARAVDAAIAAGKTPGSLAGVPFAVKNLFDVKGLPTRAGSKINRDLPAASRDATLVERLEAAGAVLVGALNMGEYAYDFTGENIHDGPSRNPHDLTRMTGGSSGGSAGAWLGHQRIDPGAFVVLWNIRTEADLRPAFPRALVSVRVLIRSCRSARALGRRPRAGLRRDAGTGCR
jgi:1-carboxybiuret hydrolase